MKSLREYIIQEKLHLDANIQIYKKVVLPKVVDGDFISTGKVWKEIELPKGQWLIYKDKYRSNDLHFSGILDFLSCMCYLHDDFEDFNISKDILYSSNDFYDTFNWYCKHIGMPTYDEMQNKSKDISEIYDNIPSSIHFHESESFFKGVYDDEYKPENFTNPLEPYRNQYTQKQVDEILNNFKSWYEEKYRVEE